jgi:hypothetical protein|eukprot:COSAG01_NODE_6848_length_3470_cov_30.350044_2_plen_78_part_00
MDGSDINACDRTNPVSARCVSAGLMDARLPPSYVAFVDDRGAVNLAHWPSVIREAPCQRVIGHSSHVMDVRFTAVRP